MLPFTDFINKRSTFEDIFRISDQIGIDSTEYVNPANKILHLLKRTSFEKKMARKLSYIVVDINFKEFCESIKNEKEEEYIDENVCIGYCQGRYNTVIYDMLVEKLVEDMENRKIIFININCKDYCLDRGEEDGYCAHGTCAILVPGKNKYDMFYMNPHGEVMKKNTYYETIISRTRVKKLTFDGDIIDCLIMKTIVNYCNKKHNSNIIYDYTDKHNYYGVNLQEEDTRGVCFIFPSIVYYYFAKYYTQKRELRIKDKVKTIPSFKEMLTSGRFNLAIHSCFTDFNKNYEKTLFKHIDSQDTHTQLVEKLIKCLDKSKWHFLKNMTNSMVSFINQDYFQDKF
jgi:hypothetical protein|tara:strand:+ start:81 stop:1106 length:1026 start_codon:yes stop_codon:yes gene_type:complete